MARRAFEFVINLKAATTLLGRRMRIAIRSCVHTGFCAPASWGLDNDDILGRWITTLP